MSSLLNKELQKIKQKVCEEQGHDNQPILRICINEQCLLSQKRSCFLCADCFINHSSHFQDCIKLDQFIFKCQENTQINGSTYERKIESIVSELSEQAKNFRKKIKEMFKSFKKQLKEKHQKQITSQLQNLQTNLSSQKNSQKSNLTIHNLIKQYKGYQIEQLDIDYTSLFNTISKSTIQYFNSLLEEFQNIFALKSAQVEKNAQEINDIIEKHQNVEQASQEEEEQKDVIQKILVSQDDLNNQMKTAEEDKCQAQKELKNLQDKYFALQEQEKKYFYKLEQKKKFNVESQRSFFHKIQNLAEKQLNIKFQEEQRIKLGDCLSTNQFLGEFPPNNNQNDILIEDQQRLQREIDIARTLINYEDPVKSIDEGRLNEIGTDKSFIIEDSMKDASKEINTEEKQKYVFLEKSKVFLQQKQDEYLDLYTKDIQQLQYRLQDIEQKKEECQGDLEKAKIKYSEKVENLRNLQQQLFKNEDLKYSEKKKLLDIYKKSPIKKKILNF